MRNVYFTSFQRSHGLPERLVRYSCAVQWPAGYENIPRVEWTLILDNAGKWIRPREFVAAASHYGEDPLVLYRSALLAQYEQRRIAARQWLEAQVCDFAMLCWCPYDRAAQRQLGEFGTFVCHTDILAEFMEKALGCQVWRDSDRRLMKALS